ncbi:N-acetylmannosamine-6-phosphate 2-epimerase [Paenactinomyces guangxiensis]|uniref:Putative N-acetylmannosamine-6-phosphate 2-epimerase n=1 Tax=Paenactinomyces guangxiensis TaxID=1490290 RepID=A0A7W2A5Z9_9BACL|nr:N-acetylmannosamine-6-phosphate 2-epimerase [Paenactinomyces guangxiensis]MBA4492856.1 N-acetylmannosamine-6-phosphate 2-epimerase [Paenactinomyces guangxiensis]MBH8590295.1 N-acetylmannosamine-6-phosphate 2-epimerase [Paenactinomyces guangxiensis]
MTNQEVLHTLHKQLIVSCQALEEEPLHSSFIMGKMALAAQQGGAAGIRANSKEDIAEIKKQVHLPVIGIVKRNYPDSPVYITPTMLEVEELLSVETDMIAMDATSRPRPGGLSLEQLVRKIREKYPKQLLMADVSTVEEAIEAEKLGFHVVSTTLVGYTEETKGKKIFHHDYAILKEMVKSVSVPVFAEGNVYTPEAAKHCLDAGCFAVVVGGAITRPQQITRRFVGAIS